MYHCILEEDQVHPGSTDLLVVQRHEHLQPLLQVREGRDRLVDLGHVKVSVLRLVSGCFGSVPMD